MNQASARYQCWAGIGHAHWAGMMATVLQGRGERERLMFTTIWPIVDIETCGDIDGFPKPEQCVAFCFSPEEQTMVANALNDVCQVKSKPMPTVEISFNPDSLEPHLEKIVWKYMNKIAKEYHAGQFKPKSKEQYPNRPIGTEPREPEMRGEQDD